MFRNADFDAEPASSKMAAFIEQLQELENLEPEGRMGTPDDIPQSVALKKIGIFPDYRKQRPDGLMQFDDAAVPLKRYILGMSMIYISETHHEPEEGDFRDSLIWSQAITCDCDVLWTETQWTYEHPIIHQVLDRLDREPMAVVRDFTEFKNCLH